MLNHNKGHLRLALICMNKLDNIPSYFKSQKATLAVEYFLLKESYSTNRK